MTGMTTFAGIAPDHLAALLALPLSGAAIWTCFRLVNRAAASGNPLARRFRDAYDRSISLTRRTAALLLLIGIIHLTLIPAHLVEAPATALLFALNALAFSALAVMVFVWAGWRPLACLLLGATLLAYAFYLATGQEDLDLVGVVTYAIELVTLGLVWLPATTDQQPRRERKAQAINAAMLPAR